MQIPKPHTPKTASILSEHRIAVTLKLTITTAAIIALYFQDLTLIFKGALTDESTFHILAIPFLFAYLLYRKRRMINAALQRPTHPLSGFQKYFSTLAGIALCAVAILTYWYGSYTFTPLEYHMVTLPFLTAGLVLVLFNPQTLKQLLFPIAFLTFLTPPPSEVLYGVGSALSSLSAIASNGLVNVLGIRSVLSSSNGSPLITLIKPDNTHLPFSVDVACSGIYSLIGFVIFALFIAYIMTSSRLRNKAAILILGIPLIVALNIIRITIILVIGYNYGEDLALQVFHTVGATVLMFIGTLILLAVTEKAFKKPPPTQPCISCTPTPPNPTETFCQNCGKLFKYPQTKLKRTDLAKVAAVAIAMVMLLSIQAPVFALTQGPAQVLTQTPSGPQVSASNSLLPNITGYTLNYVYRDTAFEKLSGQDASLVYAYSPKTNGSAVIWVTIEIAPSTASEHRWETCLINFPLSQGNEASVNQLDLRDVQLMDNPPMTARYFAFDYKNKNQTQVVLYWYQTATFNANGTTETKSIKMSVIMYPSSAEGVALAEEQELPIAVAINDYWAPIKTWTTVALAISQNGLALSAVAIALLAVLIVYALYLDKKEKQSLFTLYQKLPAQDQLLVQAVSNISDTGTITTQKVTSEFQKLTSTTVSEAQIMQKLAEAENAGLIKKTLRNNADYPALSWESQVLCKTSFFHRFKL